ncbi:hypothetical protein EVA_18240, partial [gut metagenome]
GEKLCLVYKHPLKVQKGLAKLREVWYYT